MRNSTFYSVCTFLLILFLSSCGGNSHQYKVDSAFADYLQRFENEGATRGHTFNVEKDGLIIQFGTLTGDVAGLTHYETPIRIEIDKTYWDAISKTAGADLMKEDLLFHELGHGLLGRKHLNDTLENGDWKSIMCGGDKVNNRSWNINYRGERRKYYLDELFDEKTKPADFSSLMLAADTAGFKPFLQRNFDTPSLDQTIWALVDNAKYKTSLDNGRLRFQSKVDSTYLVYTDLTNSRISIQSDFSYELTFEYPTGDVTNQYGLIFGSIPYATFNVTESVEYFTVNNSQKMYMGNRTWYSFFTELTEPSILSAGKNKLKVMKIGGTLYYFINNIFAYRSEIVDTSDLNLFGFMVPPLGTVWIDNLQISQRAGTGVSSKSMQSVQNIGLESGTRTITNFNQNKIFNR